MPGSGLSDTARDLRIGWRLTPAVTGDPGFEVNLDATRREPTNDNAPPEHGVILRSLVRWQGAGRCAHAPAPSQARVTFHRTLPTMWISSAGRS